jgi:Firmicute plasmid replication protein (RepL)
MTKQPPHFNPETYLVIDRISGEEIPMPVFIEACESGYWEKAYAKTLAEYIGAPGSAPCTILAFLVSEKNVNNLINGTISEIAKKTNASPKTVSNIFKILIDRNMLKKVRNGCYFFSPEIMRHGSKVRGAMLIRYWNE